MPQEISSFLASFLYQVFCYFEFNYVFDQASVVNFSLIFRTQQEKCSFRLLLNIGRENLFRSFLFCKMLPHFNSHCFCLFKLEIVEKDFLLVM